MQYPEFILEICANGATSALAAQEGGADRIELCESLEIGGLTPSYGTLLKARKLLEIPIHVLIRPRGGDFLYSAMEFEIMKSDIILCKNLGMDGIVVGILDPNGNIDNERCRQLHDLARPMAVNFHRAFDFTRQAFEALDDLIAIGYDRVLTAGQKNTAAEGVDLISELIHFARKRIVIMPGSGINDSNIKEIFSSTAANEFHTTAGKKTSSGMIYSKRNINLGVEGEDDPDTLYYTDINKVKQLKMLISQF